MNGTTTKSSASSSKVWWLLIKALKSRSLCLACFLFSRDRDWSGKSKATFLRRLWCWCCWHGSSTRNMYPTLFKKRRKELPRKKERLTFPNGKWKGSQRCKSQILPIYWSQRNLTTITSTWVTSTTTISQRWMIWGLAQCTKSWSLRLWCVSNSWSSFVRILSSSSWFSIWEKAKSCSATWIATSLTIGKSGILLLRS